MLEIKHLTISFYDSPFPDVGLADFSMTMEPGDILGIVGESGSGKTMMALALMGLLKKTARIESGEILWMGKDLLRASEEELRSLKLGYRSRYICKTAEQVADGEIDLETLPALAYKEAREELMKLSGIGGKVADCICLFALHQMDAFPVDTHIRQVLDAHYADGFPFDRYKGCAGVRQQYIFYYDLKGGEK